jgi:hypothetical protein
MSNVSADERSANPLPHHDDRMSHGVTSAHTKDKPRLRRAEIPAYLMERHGYPIAVATLNKMATVGGGPPMEYASRFPLYPVDLLDAWVASRLSKPVNSTAERDAA